MEIAIVLAAQLQGVVLKVCLCYFRHPVCSPSGLLFLDSTHVSDPWLHAHCSLERSQTLVNSFKTQAALLQGAVSMGLTLPYTTAHSTQTFSDHLQRLAIACNTSDAFCCRGCHEP